LKKAIEEGGRAQKILVLNQKESKEEGVRGSIAEGSLVDKRKCRCRKGGTKLHCTLGRRKGGTTNWGESRLKKNQAGQSGQKKRRVEFKDMEY